MLRIQSLSRLATGLFLFLFLASQTIAQTYELVSQASNPDFGRGRRIAVDARGVVWMTRDDSRVTAHSPSGGAYYDLGGTVDPFGIATSGTEAANNGTVWVADKTRLVSRNIVTNTVTTIGLNPAPAAFRHLAIDTDGTIVTLEDSQIRRFSKQGALLQSFGSKGVAIGQFGGTPTALAVDGNSNILIADGAKSRIAVYDRYGNYQSQITDGTVNLVAWSMCVLPNGNIAIANAPRGGVEIYSPSGTLVTSLSKDAASGVVGIASDSLGRVYVLNSTTGTLRVYAEKDVTPPTSTHTISPPTYGIWSGGSATVRITAQDNLGGSGMGDIFYKIDQGVWVTTSRPSVDVTVSVLGSHTVFYCAVDKSGNVGTQHSAVVSVDNKPPFTDVIVAPGGRSVEFVAQDNESGAMGTVYAIDNGDAVIYDGNPVWLDGGRHNVYFYSMDNCSNTEQWRSIYIDGPEIGSVRAEPSTVMGGTAFTVVARLTKAAGPAGATVTILWGGDAFDFIEVPAGSLTGTLTVDAPEVTEEIAVPFGAFLGDYSYAEGSVTITPKSLFITLPAKEVMTNTKLIGKIRRSTWRGAATVRLKSSSPNVVVPATITMVDRQTLASFPITVLGNVKDIEDVVITATMQEQIAAVSLTVKAYQIVAGMFVPAEIGMGGTSTYQIYLNGPAPASGLTYGFAYRDDAGIVKSTTALRVPPGEWVGSATFTMKPGLMGTVVASATENGQNEVGMGPSAAVLLVRIPLMSSLVFNPSSVVGGTNLTGTASLDGAYTQASNIWLQSDNPVVPSNVYAKLTAGKTSTPVSMKTLPVGRPTLVKITASTATGEPVWTNVIVQPVAVGSLKLTKPLIPQNTSTTLTITMAKAVGIDTEVTLSASESGLVSFPVTVVVPKGKSTAAVTVNALGVNSAKTVTILATSDSVVFKSAVLTIAR